MKLSHAKKLFLFPGLDILSFLATSDRYELRIDLEDFENRRAYAEYG